MKNIITFAVFIFLTSCTTYRIQNLNTRIEEKSFSEIYILNSIEKCKECNFVADFEVKDDNTKTQSEIENKVLNLAKTNNANIISINNFSQGGRRINGKLYQNENFKTVETNRKVYFFRDELGAFIAATFKTKLEYLGKETIIPNRTFKAYEVSENQNEFEIIINGKPAKFELSEGNNYYLLSKNNRSYSNSRELKVFFGGQSCMKIEQKKLAKMWVSVLKKL